MKTIENTWKPWKHQQSWLQVVVGRTSTKLSNMLAKLNQGSSSSHGGIVLLQKGWGAAHLLAAGGKAAAKKDSIKGPGENKEKKNSGCLSAGSWPIVCCDIVIMLHTLHDFTMILLVCVFGPLNTVVMFFSNVFSMFFSLICCVYFDVFVVACLWWFLNVFECFWWFLFDYDYFHFSNAGSEWKAWRRVSGHEVLRGKQRQLRVPWLRSIFKYILYVEKRNEKYINLHHGSSWYMIWQAFWRGSFAFGVQLIDVDGRWYEGRCGENIQECIQRWQGCQGQEGEE